VVSQGRLVWQHNYARSDGIFNNHFTANIPRNLPVKIVNRLRFDRMMDMSLWPHFLARPVYPCKLYTTNLGCRCVLYIEVPCSLSYEYHCSSLLSLRGRLHRRYAVTDTSEHVHVHVYLFFYFLLFSFRAFEISGLNRLVAKSVLRYDDTRCQFNVRLKADIGA